MASDWYRTFGVSAHKGFLGQYHDSEYFVSVGADIAGDPAYRFALHADGVGTKGILAYLWWRETGEMEVWKNLAQDALVMNTDDLACSGITEGFVFSTTITRNPFHIPDEIVQGLIEGVRAFVEELGEMGIQAWIAGGETADMPDVVRTLGMEATAAARIHEKALLPLRRPDQEVWIVGLSSFGQATYEKAYNSGIGCNGITAIRHLLLAPDYGEKYPETLSPELPSPYRGNWHLQDTVGGFPLGKLLTAPTRTYLPVLRDVFMHYREAIYAVIHCTGGGQRKAIKYLPYTLIRKDNFFLCHRFLPFWKGGALGESFFEVLNMGHRMEIYALPAVAEEIMKISRQYGISTQVIGSAQPADTSTRIEASFGGESWVWE